MKKAGKFLSAAMALTLGVSLVAYGAAQTEQKAVAESVAQNQAVQGADDEMGGYLFVTFIGDGDGGKNDPIKQEQIYFALSRDGKNWNKINGAQPVLSSNKTIGEGGVRDPSIVRKPDGKGAYIVATDLSVQSWGGNWGALQRDGSHKLIIWESEDLINWSEPWATPEIAVENAGCAWAPEAFWDASREQYMVFWASMVGGRHRIYRSFTADFHTFTPAEIYMDEGGRPWIDATIIEDNGMFYRFTKHEGASKIYMEKSASLDGPFEMVDTYTLDGQPCYECPTGYEGPTCFKVNGEDKWCLLLDNFGGKGYVPYFTDNLAEGKFVEATDHSEDGTFRHGSVLPITNKEYKALCDKWAQGEGLEKGELIYSLEFTQDGIPESESKATAQGTVTYEQRENGRYAAVIDGDNNYLKIDGTGLINGLENMTVSFSTSLVDVSKTSWMFFAAANENAIVWGSTRSDYLGVGYRLDGFEGIRAQRFYQQSNAGRPATADKAWTATADEWLHISLVYHKGSTELYMNGELVAKANSAVSLKNVLGDTPVIHLGRASWGGGEYSSYKIGDFKIYNYARSASEVLDEYNAVK